MGILAIVISCAFRSAFCLVNPCNFSRNRGYHIFKSCQWPFQDPKLEVPTIYKAYVSGLCKGISPQNMVKNGTNVPPI